MLQTKVNVRISVECVCGAKLSAVTVDDKSLDFVVVVDNDHKCPVIKDACICELSNLQNGKCTKCGLPWRT